MQCLLQHIEVADVVGEQQHEARIERVAVGRGELAVSLDQTARQAGEAAGQASYPVLHDAGGEVGRLYDVTKMPVMVLVDRGGVVREVFEGFRRGNEEQYLEHVQALLRE